MRGVAQQGALAGGFILAWGGGGPGGDRGEQQAGTSAQQVAPPQSGGTVSGVLAGWAAAGPPLAHGRIEGEHAKVSA